jgi:broad specificity phosphatase PhoE
MPDPLLTPLGETQCASLSAAFLYRPLITHLVSSPLRRTLYTTLLSFEDIILPGVDAGKKGIRVIALPEIQETSDLPCDTGSPVELLADEFAAGKWADTVDLGFVGEGWNDKSISTRWAPTPRNLEKRSKEARLWLRSLAREWEEAREGVEGEKDAHIAVVTHGGLLHFLTEDWSGYEKHLGEFSCVSIGSGHFYITYYHSEKPRRQKCRGWM